MNLEELSSNKLSKLISEYTDHLKCLECCKYFIAPATAICGHTLCHTCWRGRRTCPLCSSSLDRKTLKLNLPLQNLTNHIQTLGEAFEKLFKIQLDEFSLDTPGDHESDRDPVKNVKDWLISSQNHFSAPIQNTETFSQVSQEPQNPVELSASNVIIHTDVKKASSPVHVTKVAYVPPPQDDWDKIEAMPDVDIDPKQNENVGPMDIEPLYPNENEYTTVNPRRSSRKREMKLDDSNQKTVDLSAIKHNSGDSSLENDKKSQKGKQTWNSVKRMRKEFSKLNKKNRGKLNVSIEMVKKTQNVKSGQNVNTPLQNSQQVVNIDDNTPHKTDKENEIIVINSNDPSNSNHEVNLSENTNKNNKKFSFTPSPIESNKGNIPVSNNNYAPDINVKNSRSLITNVSSKVLDHTNKSNPNVKEDVKMPFIKKSALCPKTIEVLNVNESHKSPEPILNISDDIEISIKIGTTITNILIKKKNDIQVKINTDREVQTSLGPHNLSKNQALSKETTDKSCNNIDRHLGEPDDQETVIQKTIKSQINLNVNKSVSEKINTASAETATVQFEITESVEKELSNVMEYETVEGQKETQINVEPVSIVQPIEPTKQGQDNLENLDELNDLDIFSGSVKEANIQLLKEHAPSEVLISTVCSKLKTQRNVEKRNRENADEDALPKHKKAKVYSPQKIKDKSMLPDSEPINYDAIMGQVFASIDADMEDIRKSQEVPGTKTEVKMKPGQSKNKDLSQVHKTQVLKRANSSNSQMPKPNLSECVDEKHSESIFTIAEKDYDDVGPSQGAENDKIPQQVQDLFTPVLCHNLDSSQESQVGSQKTRKTQKKTQYFDDSDRSVVEETPQKDMSFPKAKRTSTTNQLQVSMLDDTQKIPSKVSRAVKSIINLTDSERESNETNKDVSILEPQGKKLTLETPLTISKFADHIIHKSTPVARKSLNFDNENEDPEQTLCPTSDVIAKTTQEKDFMTKAFESTPTTPTARPLIMKNAIKATKKYCLAASRLTSDEIMKVKIVCAQQKWRYVDNYSKDITHLVVSVDEENKSQRSVKYMCALADSKWIVSFAWIEQCLRNKDTVDEEYFEALDSFGEPGPRRSRIARQKLFQGIKFYCMPPFSVLDLGTLKNMLTAAGGRVVKEIKEVRVTKDSSQPALLLAEPENTQEDRFIYLAMEHSIVPVNFEWVLNCLGSYTLGSLQELLLCPSTLLPEATARWPELLLAQDLD